MEQLNISDLAILLYCDFTSNVVNMVIAIPGLLEITPRNKLLLLWCKM